MMYMRNACMKFLALALTLGGLASLANRAQAQTVTTLVQFTNSWKYDRSGASLPATWRTNGYNDSAWASGLGLLGDESAPAPYTIYAPISTVVPVSTTVTTFYFRTTFTFNGSTNGVQLFATNLVDDGCAIYLNGRLAGGVRMPATFNSTTLFSGPANEGQLDIASLTNFLRSGVNANTLAVEVHQSAFDSSDVMFGLKLVSIAPTALSITSQPVSTNVAVGDAASFSVDVSGGPVTYRWFKDGVLQAAVTGNALSISSATLASAGVYRVVVSNSVNSVTSQDAILTVVSDTTGPEVVSAIIDDGLGTNAVRVRFSETLFSSADFTIPFNVRNTNNWRLIPVSNTNVSIVITNILYGAGSGAWLQLANNQTNWNPTGEYFLVLNRISDSKTNYIAPYTRTGVSVAINTNLTQMSDMWSYYDFNLFDPNGNDIYVNTVTPWYSMNYSVATNYGWGAGLGIFYADLVPPQPCDNDVVQALVTYQEEPTLFRRTFRLPAGFPTNGIFRFRFIADDGMAVFLNGKPLFTNNMPPGNWNYLSKAAGQVSIATCFTNQIPVSELRTGTNDNVLAVAVHQTATIGENDTVFGLEMDGIFLRTPVIPVQEPPASLLKLNYSYNKNSRQLIMSWPTNFSGFSLVAKNPIGTNSSLPAWTQIPDQTNPYTNSVPANFNRFFEIKKL